MIVTRQLQCLGMDLFSLYPRGLQSRVIRVPSKYYSTITTATRIGIKNTAGVFDNALVSNSFLKKFLFHSTFSKMTVFFRQQKSMSGSVSKIPFNINKNISQDILVFSNENESLYKFLTIFGVLQMFMWGYLSLSPVQNLRKGPVTTSEDLADLPWWKRWLYKEGRYKNAITGIGLTVGTSILFVTLTYPQRAIRSLWLLKGGKNIKITTYSYFKQSQSLSIPLEHVNCLQSRTGDGSQIPLKIKDRSFFFLMDKQGTFHHPEMFDFVIGLKRNI